jgi:hypothetical protein
LALDWLAALVTHIPDKGQQLRCYGRYSNVCQGRRKRMSTRALQPDDHRAEGEDGQFRKQCREDWARLIKKMLEVDPLICSKCQGVMKSSVSSKIPQSSIESWLTSISGMFPNDPRLFHLPVISSRIPISLRVWLTETDGITTP